MPPSPGPCAACSPVGWQVAHRCSKIRRPREPASGPERSVRTGARMEAIATPARSTHGATAAIRWKDAAAMGRGGGLERETASRGGGRQSLLARDARASDGAAEEAALDVPQPLD